MYKIFLTVRNRLAITTKCVTALKKHATIPNNLYVYDNLTNHRIQEHFMYWSVLYEKGMISQVTFNTEDSTFRAFSKAVACNQFGIAHSMDPHKNGYDFLLFIDNDIIVHPGFDRVLKETWDHINKNGLSNVKVVTQAPGGIMGKRILPYQIFGRDCIIGHYGGSGFWSVRPDFFDDVGLLKIGRLIGLNKKHDQEYWKLLAKFGNEYIIGVNDKMAMHCGGEISGSVCNTLTRLRIKEQALEKIKFEEAEAEIDKLTFDEFYSKIKDKDELHKW